MNGLSKNMVLPAAMVFALWQAAGCAPRGIEFTGEPNHVVVLPGILGDTPDFDRIRRIADKQLEDTSAQVWNWTLIKRHIIPNPVAHIMQYERNRARAGNLADHITRFRREHPEVNLSVVALSGGVPVAVFALEALPDDVTIQRLVLLSGALSPGYDLTKALSHVEREAVSYYSRGDWLILKKGTRRFGTGDRVFSESAGYCGFDVDEACPRGCENLVQIRWHEGMRNFGNRGGHAGSLSRAFIRECVLGWLQGDMSACAAPDNG